MSDPQQFTVKSVLNPDLYRQVHQLAKADGRSVSNYVRQVLAEHVYDRASRTPEAASHAVSAERLTWERNVSDPGDKPPPDPPPPPPAMERLHRQARPYTRKDSSR